MKQQDFLIEIGTEELPPKSLRTLAENFAGLIINKMSSRTLVYKKIDYFATPRRLAVLIHQLEPQQSDRIVKYDGPFVRAAYDSQNQPTKALEGFARKCGVAIEELEIIETEQGGRLVHSFTEKGKHIKELMPAIIREALQALPIIKPMRWGERDIEFVRPVHWITLLYGKEEISAEILGHFASRITYGHRFLYPQAISLTDASEYEKVLYDKGKVIADFEKRKQLISEEIQKKAAENECSALIEEDLLNEVTGLVEWPVALLAKFDEEFLDVPREALISSMQHHQKSFALFNAGLRSQFITISNIESKDPAEVIRGNERVMRARLSDAKFFYDSDRKTKLIDRLEALKNVTFQAKLGNLYEKSQRIALLAKDIGEKITSAQNPVNLDLIERASLLCKTDLLSAMVGEFPELQGIMGLYYARNDGEDERVGEAIQDHYHPRFAGDSLPETVTSCTVALADRIDTLVGIFGINQIPTGDKDPFGLRRATVGILRIIIEKELDLDLHSLLAIAQKSYQQPLPNTTLIAQIHIFIIERLRAWYLDKNIPADVITAVLTLSNPRPLDIDHRIKAVHIFKNRPEAPALAEANKRVHNLLKKNEALQNSLGSDPFNKIEGQLFQHDAEHKLYDAIKKHHDKTKQLISEQGYTNQLLELAYLQKPLADFFEKVMIMDENEALRNNRLALLASLRNLFLEVADISQLQF